MAQLNYLGTWKDSWAILGAILEPGDVSLVPDLNYEEPQSVSMTVLDKRLKDLLKTRRSVFIWSQAFSLYPPHLQRIEGGRDAGRYHVDISRGGPGLELTLPACYRQGNDLHLAPGILSYQRNWLNPDTQTCEKAPEQLKAGYKAILARVKTRLVHHRFHVPIWIGKDALHEIQENKARIHGFGLD